MCVSRPGFVKGNHYRHEWINIKAPHQWWMRWIYLWPVDALTKGQQYKNFPMTSSWFIQLSSIKATANFSAKGSLAKLPQFNCHKSLVHFFVLKWNRNNWTKIKFPSVWIQTVPINAHTTLFCVFLLLYQFETLTNTLDVCLSGHNQWKMPSFAYRFSFPVFIKCFQ